MKCTNCNNTSFYKLQNDYIKCKTCAKKYSLKKLEKNRMIKEAFLNKQNALNCSKELGVNYRTVKDRYDEYRYFLAKFLEEEYNNTIKDNSQYEEYFYFKTKQKYRKDKSLYEAINIMGFCNNDKVYTLLMPKLTIKSQGSDKHFETYLNWHKIHSQNSYKTRLYDFWKFLEVELKQYKGVDEDMFFYYLKECEFRFNYDLTQQKEILFSYI